ncbi:amino acid permease [Aeromicrobium sp. Root236]|uniref:APC family permease n=1 Tax=Aeromicrobium sp. Root236 TaxID=1736498 RepID=UPI0006F4E8D7|nr:APC family permease [Aeromicrobium sp. Root236]KRC65799.1 amino acid permease [Aeromicrobium sp. Root236]
MTAENIDRSTGHELDSEVGQAQSSRLHGDMGVGELVMSVLAFSAPLTTVAGFIPVLLSFSGSTAPAIYLAVTGLLIAFSIGFTAMGRVVLNPGGFYSFVTAGLGRPAGLGGAFLATFGYMVIGLFAPPFFAITIQRFITDTLNGPHIAWYWFALGIITVTTSLAYRRIDLSAKVLTLVMLLEVVVVIAFDVFAFAHGGPAGGGGAGFTLPRVTDSNVGLAVLFVVGNFLGFEATVIYRDEVRDPKKTIPRATYLAVAGIGVFYAIAAWAYLAFFGAASAQADAGADTAGLFNSAISELFGKTVVDVVTILLITSTLACMLSIQNVSARYLFSLGGDRVLPEVLGKVHPKHGSPSVAASTVGFVWAMSVVLFAVGGMAPEPLYAKASGAGTFAILLLMFAASIAVLAYFARGQSSIAIAPWKTILAPAVSVAGLGGVAWLAFANYSDLLGEDGPIATILLGVTFGLFVVGLVLGDILRRTKPEVYERIGRQGL